MGIEFRTAFSTHSVISYLRKNELTLKYISGSKATTHTFFVGLFFFCLNYSSFDIYIYKFESALMIRPDRLGRLEETKE